MGSLHLQSVALVPIVSIAAGYPSTFQPSSEVRLAGTVASSSVCANQSVSYTWTSNVPSLNLTR